MFSAAYPDGDDFSDGVKRWDVAFLGDEGLEGSVEVDFHLGEFFSDGVDLAELIVFDVGVLVVAFADDCFDDCVHGVW